MEYTHVRHADSLGITLPFGAATWTPGFNDTWQPVFRENIADMKTIAILPVWRSCGSVDHDASSPTSGTRYLEAWAFSIYHIYLAIPQANTIDSVQWTLVYI